MIAYIACLRRRAFYPSSMGALSDELRVVRGALMANLLKVPAERLSVNSTMLGA